MQIRVRYVFRPETGEVEVFRVEVEDGAPASPDHDARHEQAAHDVARIVDRNARIEEVVESTPVQRDKAPGSSRSEQAPPAERRREEPMV